MIAGIGAIGERRNTIIGLTVAELEELVFGEGLIHCEMGGETITIIYAPSDRVLAAVFEKHNPEIDGRLSESIASGNPNIALDFTNAPWENER